MTFLHWTEGTSPTVNLQDASVSMTGEYGSVVPLVVGPLNGCLGQGAADEIPGVCFVPASLGDDTDPFQPGETVSVEISLPDGRSLSGQTTLPDDFFPARCESTAPCEVQPLTNVEVSWSRSSGAWAYASATRRYGIREAMAPLGFTVNQDPLNLTGLSVSETDTTIVFPRGLPAHQERQLGPGVGERPAGGPSARGFLRDLRGSPGPQLRELAQSGGLQALEPGEGPVPSRRWNRCHRIGGEADVSGERGWRWVRGLV